MQDCDLIGFYVFSDILEYLVIERKIFVSYDIFQENIGKYTDIFLKYFVILENFEYFLEYLDSIFAAGSQ